jgi:hypothetical protein
VHNDRNETYGHPLDNHSRTAGLFSVYIEARYGVKVELDAEAVCDLNMLQKIARRMNASHFDAIVDIIGYALNIAMIEDERERRNNENDCSLGDKKFRGETDRKTWFGRHDYR